jgi:hypothetical protein
MFTVSRINTAKLNKVETVLSSIFDDNDLDLNSYQQKQKNHFAIEPKGKSVLLTFSNSMPAPAFTIELSKTIPSEIITLGYDSNSGAYQFFIVKNGKLRKLAAYFDGITENKNLDLLQIYKQALDKNLITPLPSKTPNAEDLWYGAETFLSAFFDIPLGSEYSDNTKFFEIPEDFYKKFPTFGKNMESIKWESFF